MNNLWSLIRYIKYRVFCLDVFDLVQMIKIIFEWTILNNQVSSKTNKIYAICPHHYETV